MAVQKLQAARAASVTPSNTVDIPNIANQDGLDNRGCVLYVGTGGTLKVTTAGGDEVTFTGILSGTFVPVQVIKVWATGTSASNIIALW